MHLRRCLALALLAACASEAPGAVSTRKVEPGKADSSAEAVFVDFRFDAELITDRSWNPAGQIENQLLYTVGQLNGSRGVGRLDQVELSDVDVAAQEDGTYLVRYSARLPVAWGRRADVPNEYTLQLPRDVRSSALTDFADTYGHSCVDWGAHDVDSGSMWYYYRPSRRGCSFAQGSIMETVADVSASDIQTTGRFPEYDLVWQDNILRVVAVFGKYEDGATSSGDAGIAAYNTFAREMNRTLAEYASGNVDLRTEPEVIPSSPGVEHDELRWHGILPDGNEVEVVALLVDNVRTAGRAFDDRYGELSSDADLIFYNGHAGLGANIRALARKGQWVEGQYAVVFMNGCDSYAYVDSALWDAHAEINPDDAEGTKYLDLISNALPSYFRSMPRATLALIDGLLAYDAPRTYEQIFADIDSQQVVLVSGEQDNTFTPGGGGVAEPEWNGLSEAGALARGESTDFETPVLPAGRYVFELDGEGDADLYVRIGAAPTEADYDCRPYRSDSRERCEIDLAADAPLFVAVRGYSESSFTLAASRL
ncbi:MAG: PPC domain-containing protein [Myxococcota bacterium]